MRFDAHVDDAEFVLPKHVPCVARDDPGWSSSSASSSSDSPTSPTSTSPTYEYLESAQRLLRQLAWMATTAEPAARAHATPLRFQRR